MDHVLDEPSIAAPMAELEMRRRLFEVLPVDPTHAGWLRQRAWVRIIIAASGEIVARG